MSFTDFIQLQNDVAHSLASDPTLANVNIVTRDRLLADSSQMPDQTLMAETLAYLTPRNGKTGCGVIVEKPELVAPLPNVPGPQGDLVIVCLVLEDPFQNLGVNGTLMPADQVAQKIQDICHLWNVEGLGMWRADTNAISAARDWEPLRAFRSRMRIANNRGQSQRVERVNSSVGGGTLTLTCATAGAAVYYSKNGAFPGPSNTAAGAVLYAAPFAVSVGDVVRAAAFKTGMVGSPVTRFTV
jgi:hypothetical protein